MSLLDQLGDLMHRVKSGDAPDHEVHAAYDQVAGAVPNATLADGLSHAFKSDQTPPFEQMVSNLFHRSGPEQKAGLLNQLLGVLGATGFAHALGGRGADLASAGGTVTPQVAEQISPEAVQVLARQAAAKDPSIIDKAASFYSEHPTLVKAIGAGALALLMSRISASRR